MRIVSVTAILLTSSWFSSTCRADLLPAEVAIVAARGNRESEQLAEYYAKVRGIPADHICLVDLPVGEECSREEWTTKVRPAIRQWLAEHDADANLRCLVTTWGVPLSIGPAEPTDVLRAYQAFLAGERQARIDVLLAVIQQFNALAPASGITTDAVGASQPQPAAPAEVKVDDKAAPAKQLEVLETALESSLKAAQARIAAMPAGTARTAAQGPLQQQLAAAGGASVILQNLGQQLRANPLPAMQSEFDRLRGAAAAWVEARAVLEQRPASMDRDAAILGIVERLGGHFAVIRWLDEQIAVAARNETAASFDSELAIVRWNDGYELLRWQPNYLRFAYTNSHLRRAFPTLMVARLDAPTLALAQGLVDATIAAEKTGLQGRAYFDARGLAPAGQASVEPGSSADFDRALLAAAAGIRENTTIETTLDEQPPPFAPEACPNAALYCGWYSLGKYIDAFDWRPGAVAYHAGGSEAARLHDAASQRWCKRLLEEGVAATIGAVAEPTTSAYPRPDEFFAALLRGDLTLGEAYWQTIPATSWSMLLIGDPLYRPFKNRRAVADGSVLRDAGR
jgi:uncharacterized protein (TIGR03790 family)